VNTASSIRCLLPKVRGNLRRLPGDLAKVGALLPSKEETEDGRPVHVQGALLTRTGESEAREQSSVKKNARLN